MVLNEHCSGHDAPSNLHRYDEVSSELDMIVARVVLDTE